MPFDIYVYVPLFDERPLTADLIAHTPPTLEQQLPDIVRLVNEDRKKEEEEKKNNPDDDPYGGGYGGGGRRRRRNRYGGGDEDQQPEPLNELFLNNGWVEVYSFSHGSSSGRYDRFSEGKTSEMNLMSKSDKFTPMLYVSSLRGETYPLVSVRTVGDPRGNKLKMMDFELRNAYISSCQLSGSSGGDGEPTRSFSINYSQMVVRNVEIDLDTGDIVSSTRGFWDSERESGAHDGFPAIPSLLYLARKVVVKNTNMYDKKDLTALMKLKLVSKEDLPIDLNGQRTPVRGKRLYVSPETDKVHYKEFNLKVMTLKSLAAAVAEVHGVAESRIKHVYRCWTGPKTLIHIANDTQVEDLLEDSLLVADIASE